VAPILCQPRVLLAAGGGWEGAGARVRLGRCIWSREETQEGLVAAVHAQAVGFGAGALPSPCPSVLRSCPDKAELSVLVCGV